MTIKGFVSDMDGTMTDTEKMWYEGTKKFLKSYGVEYSRAVCSKLLGTADVDDAHFFKMNYKLPLTEKEILLTRRVYVLKELDGDVRIMDNYLDLIEMLKSNGIIISLASISPMDIINKILDKTNMANQFSCVISADKDGNKAAAYAKVVKSMGLRPSECFALEDSPTGARAAKKAGLYCVVIPNPVLLGADFSFADEVHKSIKEFLANGKILKGMVI